MEPYTPWYPIKERAEAIAKESVTYTSGQTKMAMAWLRLAQQKVEKYQADDIFERASLKLVKMQLYESMRAVRERRVALLKMGKVEPL